MTTRQHLRFAKYEGIGNDFVMIADPSNTIRLAPDLIRKLCDRRFGIGADGVIRVAPARPEADLFMDYVNSDGSIGEMCGNGIRCLAVFARETGLTSGTELRVDTRAGVKEIKINQDGSVTVDMGPPVFEPSSIPVEWPGPDALHAKVELPNQVLEAACVSMGNPHAVVFVEDLEAVPVASLGPQVENHPMFPRRANVEFVRVVSENTIDVRVWERGSGQTLACGTGACAAAVGARLLRETGPRMTVVLPGGELEVAWSGSDVSADAPPVLMTGPATKVFEGDFDLS
jgi:diaminopimelate epimerase